MSPNPGDYKPCTAEEIKEYKREVLSKNIFRLKRAECPDCKKKELEFTGELLDLDAAFIRCKICNYQGWILLKDTGLPSEYCRYLSGKICVRTRQKCIFLDKDMRGCKLFKEAISVSHQERMLNIKREIT